MCIICESQEEKGLHSKTQGQDPSLVKSIPYHTREELSQRIIHEETSVHVAKECFSELWVLVLHYFLGHSPVLALAVDHSPGKVAETKHAYLVPPLLVDLSFHSNLNY